ncbi:hypothetical protein BDV59DRAFT_187062 [Aspergillus ambiguus]|uniref:uncharacterized protein n=1 Tax=Aspergillus ambiguus TaxID=176160 RepID=UPI003CCD0F40
MVQVLNKRRPPRKPITSEDAWRKVEDIGKTLIERSLRNKKDERAAALGVSSLSQIPTSTKDQKFRQFLDSLRLRCHPHSATAVLLCCIAIGKDNIVNMNRFQRNALLDKFERERNGPILSSPVLQEIANSQRIPEMKGKSYQPTLATRDSHSNIDGATYEHAFLEGLATVFKEDLCGIISRVPTQVDGETVWKAAVTTAFPLWGGLVNCLMSLDICTAGVDYLAMALFNAKINQAEPLRYIDFDDGPTLIVPDSESTMKGVKEEAIVKVFGVEIQEAIRDSPVRRKELEQRRQLTECVSMIVTRQGAIVNLSLDLNRGIEISRKLYA